MGEQIKLTCSDGVTIGAYKAMPAGKPKGGMVVVQEIFGVNHHIRNVVDQYAARGYVAIAPAVFDRGQADVDLGYTAADIAVAREIRAKVPTEKMLLDIEAAVKDVASAGKVGVVGYCLGGTLAYAAAVKLPGVSAAVGYYGGGIAAMAHETPKAPTMLHFGERDHSIPLTDVEKIKQAQPDLPIFVYPAEHGFSCDERASFDKASSDQALARTLEFFDKHL
jgi:carboxymethylenebutenolidase